MCSNIVSYFSRAEDVELQLYFSELYLIMAVVFIQGASRGIGLEFARTLAARRSVMVVAGCRDPDSADQLHQVKNSTTTLGF